ncbi:LAFA_0A04082g1_1 [Lachancea sp. 'fantastica']|nr:LAFA_0A04082g1_1 [Lachancea sp. 'fantastica']
MDGSDLSATFKRRKPIEYHRPIYSNLTTFSFANGPTVFSPRRKMTADEPKPLHEQDNLGTDSSDEMASNSPPAQAGFYHDMREAILHAGRAVMTIVGLPGSKNAEEKELPSKQDTHIKRELSESNITPNKKLKTTDEPGAPTNNATQTPSKADGLKALEKKLENSITPERNGGILFSTKKDPMRWDFADSNASPVLTESVPYGSAFVRKRASKNNSGLSQGQITARSSSEEISYLRMVYNGHYKAPDLIESHKNEQLLLREQELKQFSRPSSQPWSSLTEKVKDILSKSLGGPTNDDLIIIKEQRVLPTEARKEQTKNRSFRFDTSVLTFKEEFESYRKLKEERERIQNEVRKLREKPQSLVPALVPEDLKVVKNTLCRSDNGIIMNKNNIELKVYDFKTLAPNRWLNDIIIEFFMKHIELTTSRAIAFSSYFYTSLSRNGYQGVRRWMKKKKADVNHLDMIFAPINLNQSHWALGVIDIKNRKIFYVDSLSSGPSTMSFAILRDLQNYICQESKNTLGADFELIHEDCPQQPNGFDCGVYVCTNALYLSKGVPLAFEYRDVQKMRPYIGHLILTGD